LVLKKNETKTKVLIQANTSRQVKQRINAGGDDMETGTHHT